jgi:hypothetical protein
MSILNQLIAGNKFLGGVEIKPFKETALANGLTDEEIRNAIINAGASRYPQAEIEGVGKTNDGPQTQITQHKHVIKAVQVSTALAKDEALTQINTAAALNNLAGGVDVAGIKKVAIQVKGSVAEGGNEMDKKVVDDAIKNVGIDPDKLPKIDGKGGEHIEKGDAGGFSPSSINIKPGENKGPKGPGHH